MKKKGFSWNKHILRQVCEKKRQSSWWILMIDEWMSRDHERKVKIKASTPKTDIRNWSSEKHQNQMESTDFNSRNLQYDT